MDLGISGQEETQKGKSGNSSSCNDEDESTGICSSSSTDVEKEHMFDKVVTPSDVGKLNRLVIPKQHAEKYFPLDGAGAGDKGLLLSFEDCNGKLWRFRYSYWNSSQSYVMTKGWSRFVKDKKLDAGDIVTFHRGLAEAARDRLFIDCRRRADVLPYNSDHSQRHYFPLHRSEAWNPMLMPPQPPPHLITGRNAAYCGRGSVVYLGSAAPAMGIGVLEWQHQQQEPVIVFDSIPVVQGKSAAKRLRLFGVNMDCPLSETAEQQVLASAGQFSSQQHPNSSSNAGKGKSSMSLDLDI